MESKQTHLVRDENGNLIFELVPVLILPFKNTDIFDFHYVLTEYVKYEIKKWLKTETNKDTYHYKCLAKRIDLLMYDSNFSMEEHLQKNSVTFNNVYKICDGDKCYDYRNECMYECFSGWDFGLGFENKETDVGGRYALTLGSHIYKKCDNLPLFIMLIYYRMSYMPVWNSDPDDKTTKITPMIHFDKLYINRVHGFEDY